MKSDLKRGSNPVIPIPHGRRLTLFDIIEWTATVMGVVAGALPGRKHFGTMGSILGVVVGGLGGFLLGRVPLFLGLQLLGLHRKDTEELEAIFLKDRYYIFHLALRELMSRGINISPQKPRILDLLLSTDSDRRSFGWTCLQIAFPELARELCGFSSENPSTDHLHKIRAFKEDAEPAARDESTESQT